MNTEHLENPNKAEAKVAISYVRFSSRKQRFGKSVERQLDETRAFCQEHKLNLDESRSIMDPGLSAFRGANTAQGNLGTFIRAVKAGRIEVPIVLCVEALDRITRQETTEAVHLLTELLLLGVEIGLVSDDKILTHAAVKNSPVELIVATTYLIRGYDESRMKFRRTSDAVKRMIATVKQGKPCQLGGYLPPWYRFDKEKNRFVRDDAKAAIVKRVFDAYLNGKGTTAIVKDLVGYKVPKWNDTKDRHAPWRAGGVRSMLRNKQVIGTLTLGGVEYPNYLKPIVPEADFNKVQMMLDKNTTRHGKHDARINNLFNGHIFCKSCRKPLGVHKSSSANYYHCFNARDYGCQDKKYVKADDVEQWVFGVLLKKAPSILRAEKDTKTAREIDRLETELASIRKKRKNTLILLEDDTTNTDDLKPILADLKTRERDTEKALREARVKHSERKTAPKNLAVFLQLIARDLRDQTIRQQIKALVPTFLKRVEIELETDTVRVQLLNGAWLGDYMTDEQAEEAGL
ncbi:MAG TPA: recombinase family protein [Verrucomicrobiae bacterium]|nr:recombinase family protein [Verrucomicrobiae bacterium]